jgi:Na+(H+)/acetate symporter ActP
MNITNNERIADILRLDIAESYSYRDNPTNYYHNSYQRMVNRCMMTFLFFMYVMACIVGFGLLKGILYSFGSVIIGVCGLFILGLTIITFVQVFSDLYKWIRGY